MQIIQDFFIIPAKTVFLNNAGKVVTVRRDLRLKDAQAIGLRPVLIYSLVLEELGFKSIQLADWDAPLPARTFLTETWLADLFGTLPDAVKVGARFIEAMPWLPGFLDKLNIKLIVASGKDKRYSSYQRSTQEMARYSCSHAYLDPGKMDLADANAKADISCSFHSQLRMQSCPGEAALAYQQIVETNPSRLDIEPEAYAQDFSPGAWLLTNQASIPALEPDEDVFGREHTEDLKNEEEDEDDYEEVEDSTPSRVFYAQEEVKALLPFWPVPRNDLLQNVGMTSKEFDWYLSGKRGATHDQADDLMSHFGLEWDEPALDGYCYPRFVRDYALLAGDKTTPKQLRVLHDTLTQGDVGLGFELLPASSRADPSWRYLLDGDDLRWFVVALPRGSLAASVLDEPPESRRALMNTTGPKTVPDDFYRAIVTLCAKAADFTLNWRFSSEVSRQLAQTIFKLARF